MSDNCRESAAHLLSAETQEQLIETRDVEIIKIMTLRLVLKNVQRIDVSKMDLTESEQVERALKVLSVSGYLRLSEQIDDYLLNLRECTTVNLTYTERKAVRQHLTTKLETTLKPIANFGKKMRMELPEIFVTPSQTLNSFQDAQPALAQILALESERRSNLEKLVTLRNRKCAYLKAAAELKLGPYLAHEVELLYTHSKLDQIEANVLRGFMVNELCTRTDRSLKAIKEVEGYIDKALEQTEQE